MRLDSFKKDGVVYYQLYCSCPVCDDRGKKPSMALWKHGDNDCGGDIYVGDDAICRCVECGEQVPIISLSFSCPLHDSDIDDYLIYFSKSKLSLTPSLNLNMVQHTGVNWLVRFLVKYEKLFHY